MAATNFSGPVVSAGGFTGDVTGDVSGNIVASSLRVVSYADTAIADKDVAPNIANKSAGTLVFDNVNGKLKVATGSGATDTWVDADGTNAVTPS